MEHTSRPGDVADPRYTGEFEATWQGCAGGLHRPAGRAAIKGKGDDETLLQGERFADRRLPGKSLKE